MCHWSVVMVFMIFATVRTEIDSREDQPPYTYSFSNPSPPNFHDIYPNMVTSVEEKRTEVIGEEVLATTTVKEDNYLLRKDQSQYVEFHPEFTTVTATAPPPQYLVNTTYVTSPTAVKGVKYNRKTTTTEEPDDLIKVVPRKNIERGVLDLLLPESRVKTFRHIFNTFRKMLSYTFRR